MKRVLKWLVLWYLRFFAKIALFISKPTIIGITGSVGKSSTRNAVSVIFTHFAPTKKIIEGNSETGIPLGLLGFSPYSYSFFDWLGLLLKAPFGIFNLIGTKYLIVEMGIDSPDAPKNMEYLLTIIQPHVSIFLNVYAVHSEQFEKKLANHVTKDALLTAIAAEKGKIITDNPCCKVAIYNSQNKYIENIIKQKRKNQTALYSFGEEQSDAIKLTDYEVTLTGTRFELQLKNKKKCTIFIQHQILPQVYFEVFAAALLTAQALHVPLEEADTYLSDDFSLPKSRGSILSGISGSAIIDSSYNASSGAVLSYLDLLEELKKKYKRPIVFLFGDMRELGKISQDEHKVVAKRLISVVDYVYCVGPLTKEYVYNMFQVSGFKFQDLKWFKNAMQVGEYIKTYLPKNAIILVKGSQNELFLEETVKMLLKNAEDANKLCRQSDFWMKRKKLFFSDAKRTS